MHEKSVKRRIQSAY